VIPDSRVRHEFHIKGDRGHPVVLPLNMPYRVLKTVVTRTGRGPSTAEDEFLFEHYVSPETEGEVTE